MAEIVNPRLRITTDEHNADCRVTATVTFTPGEVAAIEAGRWYVLHCTLYEKDRTRNQLITYLSSQFLPLDRDRVVARQPMSFGAVVPRGRLNRDIGRDEVFARLSLVRVTATGTARAATADTNIVRRRF